MALSKKIFIASLALLALSLIFWGIYILSFQRPAAPAPVTSPEINEPAPAPEPPAPTAKITPVIDEAAISPVIAPDKTTLKYFTKETGQLNQVSLDGTNKQIVNTKEQPGLVSALWSSDANQAILRTNTSGKNGFYYYNYANSQGVQLSENIDTLAWQNDNKIIYKYFDPKTKKGTLEISNPDNSNWNKITENNFRYVSIAPIPRTGLVSFWNYADAFTETQLQSIPVIGGGSKTLMSGKFGADYLWSHDGSQLLVSNADAKAGTKIQLAVANDQGGEYKNLEIPTFVSKCVWSKDNITVYYSLPGNIPANSILPNDYNDNKFTTADTFWKVNTATGEKTRIVDLGQINGEYDATGLFLNFDESMLFFTNRADGKLFRIDL